ncbi:peptidoglycan-associated lipoprotein Pal [Neisseriaceae bacterium TC5R-5]|nr:peptidoglycan-associated lipoprotein Pal [Neisseriaceae bacterium TC5R-5]
MNWKPLIVSMATATLLAACASTPSTPTGTTSAPSSDNTPSTQTDSTKDGNTGINSTDRLGSNPLNDPNSPLAKRSVYFAFDSTNIGPGSKPVIDTHATFLKQNSGQQVVIQGNTDIRGSREYNLALGQRRAESVKQAMRLLGVPENQLEAVSFGKEKPRATGNSEADHAENRRADIVYQNQ